MVKEREKLLRLAHGRNVMQKIALRANIVLEKMEGANNSEIARKLNTTRPTVILWTKRYEQYGYEGLLEELPKKARKPAITKEKEKEIVDMTIKTRPDCETHWSTRKMAEKAGVPRMTVFRIWKNYGLKPHLVRTFKLSNDPNFYEKVNDVVGLYLNPPDKALVFCVDEKSQIQALDRTQPSLPMKKGYAGTMTSDYKRNGTTTLFAALNVLDGTVIGECAARHRQREFLKFLRKVDKETPNDIHLHLIMDNYGTHKTDRVKKWVSAHERVKFHFTPTGCSWLNMVEIFFNKLTTKRIRRGTFRSVSELEQAIAEYIDNNNQNPTKFVWTKSPKQIFAKVKMCKDMLGTLH